MRLESITVRNYRLHREQTIEFDPASTLIGGPNESGKSTLIEAAHRALFLRAKTGGEAQKSMRSHRHAGAPEVEVRFAAGGRRWHLHKRFDGAKGGATLSEAGGKTLQDAEAEDALGRLLGTENVGGKSAGRVSELWAHLWIWQGCAAQDPTPHAAAHCDDLRARLQREGGAAAVESAGDKRVARMVAEKAAALFKDDGQPRAKSALAEARALEQQAGEAQQAAQRMFEQLENAVVDFRAAEDALRTAAPLLEGLQREHGEDERKLARVVELRGAEERQNRDRADADGAEKSFAKLHDRIAELRAELAKSADLLAPFEQEIARFADESAACQKAEANAEGAWQQASEAMRAALRRNELAAAWVEHFVKTAARHELAERLAEVQKARRALAEHQAALAQLPPIDAKKLRALQELESESAQAAAALEAMAAGLEVLASDKPVRVGESTLAAGETRILTEATDLAIGAAIRLRIRPGGGASLAAARTRLGVARESLQREIDALGVASVAAASEAWARRQQLDGELKMARTRLETLGAETIDGECAAAESARAAAEAEVGRRAALVAGAPPSATLEAARASVEEGTRQHRAAEQTESKAAATRKKCAEKRNEAQRRLETHRQDLQTKRRQSDDLRVELQLLDQHGGETARAARLAALAGQRRAAGRVLETTRAELAALQPGRLAQHREQIARAMAAQSQALRDAEIQRARAEAELRRDGASDPTAELIVANERLRAAREKTAREQRHADAIALLHALFVEEQKALEQQLTAPLVEKISGYLECLFGPGARAEVTLQADGLQGLQLIRPAQENHAFDFEELSGGAREQFAAGVRLAVAEVLAAGHDGCLPVVFDDAFANSDPERVHQLQNMLYLAAARGLQIILLTCNPADYAALGAKTISLRVERGSVAY